MNTNEQKPVDVLAVMLPRPDMPGRIGSTGAIGGGWTTELIARKCKISSAAARAALRREEKAGNVECAGRDSGTYGAARPYLWRVTDAALARVGAA